MGLKWDDYHLPTGAGFRNHPPYHLKLWIQRRYMMGIVFEHIEI